MLLLQSGGFSAQMPADERGPRFVAFVYIVQQVFEGGDIKSSPVTYDGFEPDDLGIGNGSPHGGAELLYHRGGEDDSRLGGVDFANGGIVVGEVAADDVFRHGLDSYDSLARGPCKAWSLI